MPKPLAIDVGGRDGHADASPFVARLRPVALLGRAWQLCPGISDLDFLGDF